MEATQANMSSGCSNHAVSINRTTAPRYESYRGLMGACPETKWLGSPSNSQFKETVKLPGSVYHPQTQAPTSAEGVSNCYVFKSRLQEYAQKVELPTPTYETIKEGPSHAPSFRSTVIVGGARYDSLLGFYNRKAAEQSAAEVALMNLSASGDKKESISVPVHETGLCKNVLQEYAQKMNYAIPTYTCKKEGATGRSNLFSCAVDIGGIQYIGTAATSKKEAEIKAARTALLAIHSSRSVEGEPGGKINYTVVPLKRKVPEPSPPQDETSKPKKSKKPRYRNKRHKKTQPGFSDNQIQAGNMAICVNNSMGFPTGDQNVQVAGDGQSGHCLESSAQVNGATNVVAHIGEPSEGEGDVGSDVQVSTNASQLTVSVKNNMDTTGDQNVRMANDGQSGHCLENSAQVNEATNMTVDAMVHIGEPSEGEGDGGSNGTVSANARQLSIFQQEGGMNTGSGNTVVSLTDANSNNGPTNMIPMEVSTVKFMDYEKVGNGDHGIDNIIPSINTQAYQQVVAVISDSRTEPGDSGDGPTDVKALLPVVDPVDHVVEASTGISDAVRTDSRTEPGDSGDGPTAAEAVLPGVGPVDHVAVSNASPLREESNTGTSDTIRPDSRTEPVNSGDGPTAGKAVLPCVGLVDHVVATNASPPREETNTGTSDAVRSDSRTEPGHSGDGPTDAKALSLGVGPLDHLVTANASSLKEESYTGTSETKVKETSAVDAVISCSDQTVNDADSNA